MSHFRPFVAAAVAAYLALFTVSPINAANPPIGILTLATHAHLDEAIAFPGLSVFEGERLSTEAEGRLGVRAGHSVLTLGEKTEVAMISVDGGIHMDMSSGSVHFSATEKEFVEVHVEDAVVRPAGDKPTQAWVTMIAPRVLQITAEHGSLNFSCREDFRNLPEGQTYRIYLDSPTGPEDVGTGEALKAGRPRKVAYFIVGAGVVGATSWGVFEVMKSGNPPISPAKP